jgi:hypothetical protein
MRAASCDLVEIFRKAGHNASLKSTSSFALRAIELFGAKVEICCVAAPDPVAVAKGFDWSVCLGVAWLQDRCTPFGPINFWVDQHMLDSVKARRGDLELLRDTTPDSTLRRGYVFQYRFGLRFLYEDQIYLAKLFLKKNGFNVTPGGELENQPKSGSEGP